MMSDEAYAQVVEALIDDETLDAVCVGCVPLTAALNTLAPGAGHGEDFERAGSLSRRLAALRRKSSKPWVAIVDAGALYDPMARALSASGVPTFRSADRALRLFNIVCAHRLRTGGRPLSSGGARAASERPVAAR